jgi:hypothetical protein
MQQELSSKLMTGERKALISSSENISAKIFCCILAHDIDILIDSRRILSDILGEPDYKTRIFEWNYSPAYAREMGTPLYRQVVSFQPLWNIQSTYSFIFDSKNYIPSTGIEESNIYTRKQISGSILVVTKLLTEELEKKFWDTQNNRRVNLDPGYLTTSEMVMASTKKYVSHIYIEKGIYKKSCLYFDELGCHSYSNTFPDYRTKGAKRTFSTIRDMLIDQVAETDT